ncbi:MULTISPECIES: DUF1365 domain-containing protein [unclassified Crossiella]|uniref:DUF1365 domain-containing protein n=1 Tax=unclassified Crossiella TaxID=2620835 RepID=UPI001FFE4B0C|nr:MULTISPECIES: DUF1365 domain-containing protein [unclassified Crossiella]MCK2240879.1 DUF1365 domain-containing protein [Crossiella sp. S99.2]MCK2253977.1 DUF1365 domain-containing protein [Crossiella sp. S99.1]
MVNAALYEAEVTHVRRERVRRVLRHKVYLWLVDLDELPRLPWWLRPFARFEARDHLGSPERTIRANVAHFLARRGIDLRGGRVVMMANARLLGHVFNPISVFWCHRPDGGLECVLAEVHNTYGERHCYVLHPDEDGRVQVDKEFYVSPFLAMGGRYQMRISPPGERVAVTITLRQQDKPPFVASLRGRRRPVTPGVLASLLLRRPLLTYRVSALIRLHGIALWLRRVPVVRRLAHVPQEGIQ